jgi:hypothetical protein
MGMTRHQRPDRHKQPPAAPHVLASRASTVPLNVPQAPVPLHVPPAQAPPADAPRAARTIEPRAPLGAYIQSKQSAARARRCSRVPLLSRRATARVALRGTRLCRAHTLHGAALAPGAATTRFAGPTPRLGIARAHSELVAEYRPPRRRHRPPRGAKLAHHRRGDACVRRVRVLTYTYGIGNRRHGARTPTGRGARRAGSGRAAQS